MEKTESFRNQHKEILQVVREISPLIKGDQVTGDVNAVRNLLSTLAGKLNVHLSMEDKVLYPKLLDHQDANVRLMANKFNNEMGKIKEVFQGYLQKWQTGIAIQKDPASFTNDTKGIFDAISKRIERENNELYALVDRLS